MNFVDPKPATPRGVIGAVVYNLLTIVLFPVSLIGYIVWVGKAVMSGRNTGVSGTAQGPLSARWFMHNLGSRNDEISNQLMMVLPGVPALGMRLVAWPMTAAHRLTGYVPRAFRYPFEGDIPREYEASARVTFFDDVVDRYLPQIKQFVLLGAGFDSRALRIAKFTAVKSFEVDMPRTQAIKREMLARIGITAGSVKFVPADFEQQDWLKRLVEEGFNPKEPTLFLWEGVIVYLDKEAVEDTLRKIASTAKGSVLAFDYMTTEPLESKELYWRYARAGTKTSGEPLKFGIDSTSPSRERLAEFLKSCGLTLHDQRTLGDETGGKRAWGGFAIALVE